MTTQDFEVGQTVALTTTKIRLGSASGYENRTLNVGDEGIVTRVTENKVLANFRDETPPSWKSEYEAKNARLSFWLPKSEVQVVAAALPGTKKAIKPKARKLGQAPEGDISPDDPRLQWLWDDAAKLAQRTGYCSQYDRLVDELGIPGRPRDFTVRGTIGGIAVTGTVKARNQKEADALFQGTITAGLSAAAAVS